MKKLFQVLQDRKKISIVLTRDSVCAGDDVDAPHQKTVKIPPFIDPEVLTRETSSGYLPIVNGAGHFWICVLNDIEIAEIKTTGIISLLYESTFNESNTIHFIYKSAKF